MTQIPAGWYPDPAQTHPARQRYWDGARWTEHVHDPQPAWPTYPPAYPASQAPVHQPPAARPAPTTPDGQPLSGWWRRALAQVLDALILSPVYVGLLAAFAAANWDEVKAWFDDYSHAVDAGTSVPSPPEVFQPYSTTGLAIFALYAVVVAVYTLAFWRWKQATPGKLMAGTRIRRRETPGPMPWSTMLPRFLFVQALALAVYVPWVGFLFAMAALLDYLWPLWDSRNQALHDKVARTNVVLAPRSPHSTQRSAADRVEALTEAGLPRRW